MCKSLVFLGANSYFNEYKTTAKVDPTCTAIPPTDNLSLNNLS